MIHVILTRAGGSAEEGYEPWSSHMQRYKYQWPSSVHSLVLITALASGIFVKMSFSQLTSAVVLLSGVATAAKYEEYILAPRSRTLYPAKVHGFNGSISGTDSLLGSAGGEAVFDGVSAVTYDFGKNIAGLVSLQIGDVDEDQFIGLTYSESSLWISNISCDATEDAGMDEPYWFQPTKGGNYATDEDHVRGGFRYLTLVHNTTGSIAVESISVHFTAMPHYADDQIANYTGYFHCDDELLNRIWYAGAYTNQLCTVSYSV